MSLIKTIVPNENVLNKKSKDALGAGITDFIARTKERRLTVTRNRRYAVVAVSVFVISIMALFLAHNYLEGYILNLATMYLLGLVVATFIFTHSWYKQEKVLEQELYLALVPVITSVFSRLNLYTHDVSHRVTAKNIIQDSGILPELDSLVSAEDVYIFFEPFQCQVRRIAYKSTKKSFFAFRNKPVTGILVDADLPKSITGQIFLATIAGRVITSPGRFWDGLESVLTPVPNVVNSKTGFADVVSTNTVEAEAFLNKDLIEVLKRWWEDHHDSIRMVVKGGKVYMYFPDHSVSSVRTSTETADLLAFALGVIKPIWRALAVLEEVR